MFVPVFLLNVPSLTVDYPGFLGVSFFLRPPSMPLTAANDDSTFIFSSPPQANLPSCLYYYYYYYYLLLQQQQQKETLKNAPKTSSPNKSIFPAIPGKRRISPLAPSYRCISFSLHLLHLGVCAMESTSLV